MTDRDLLLLLNDFFGAQKNVICFMLWAREDFELGREDVSWKWLLEWCEAKDTREKLWNQFKSDYPRAMMLKEGVGYD